MRLVSGSERRLGLFAHATSLVYMCTARKPEKQDADSADNTQNEQLYHKEKQLRRARVVLLVSLLIAALSLSENRANVEDGWPSV